MTTLPRGILAEEPLRASAISLFLPFSIGRQRPQTEAGARSPLSLGIVYEVFGPDGALPGTAGKTEHRRMSFPMGLFPLSESHPELCHRSSKLGEPGP
jgi:hypothetical protein